MVDIVRVTPIIRLCALALQAMLLGAAKILKARESSLPGTVRLVFQPAEEGGAGNLQPCAAALLCGFATPVPCRSRACPAQGLQLRQLVLSLTLGTVNAGEAALPKRRLIYQPFFASSHSCCALMAPSGGDIMVKEGALKGASAAFGMHVMPHIASGHVATRGGTIMAGALSFEVRPPPYGPTCHILYNRFVNSALGSLSWIGNLGCVSC